MDAGGIPQGWLNAEEATRQYADNSVIWTLGDPILTMRGGISRASGKQSIIELHSIIAVKGVAKINLFDVVPVITKHKLFKRDRGICAYCGDSIDENEAEAEHIIPSSRGGKYTWMNLVVSCRPCNQRKGNRTPEQAGMDLLFAPYQPSLYEDMILKSRNILADQMDFLVANLPKNSRILTGLCTELI